MLNRTTGGCRGTQATQKVIMLNFYLIILTTKDISLILFYQVNGKDTFYCCLLCQSPVAFGSELNFIFALEGMQCIKGVLGLAVWPIFAFNPRKEYYQLIRFQWFQNFFHKCKQKILGVFNFQQESSTPLENLWREPNTCVPESRPHVPSVTIVTPYD